ncbi:FxLYD domain-containing protein [Orenia marismortui]|uniref:FxLYD domain-containing protein n=1 Tax=Orenia marismortui TaxID=46469 RepID=UPI000371B10F|nr:FxLYD domain-containing protein [Orenia marismortui]
MRKKYLIYLFLCLLVASVTAFAQSFLVIKFDKTKLMTKPQGQTITELAKGTKVKILESKGNWSKIQLEGWVLKDSITDNRPPKKENLVKEKNKNKANKDSKNKKKDTKVTNSSFIYGNVTLTRSFGYTRVKGKITNYSGKYLDHAKFKITLYDSNNNLIGTGYTTMKELKPNKTYSFATSISCNPVEVENYNIEFQE